MLPLLILSCVTFLCFACAITASELKAQQHDGVALHPVSKFIFAGGVPVLVAGVMTYLFIIEGGASTAQLNAGSPSRINVWSIWVSLFSVFLLLTAASGFGTFVWMVVCAVRKNYRCHLGLATASFFLSVLAFFTVAENFPSA